MSLMPLWLQALDKLYHCMLKGDLYVMVKSMLSIVLYKSVSVTLQDVLYTICNNCGPVQRIVIFRKNGVQAMVEYPFKSIHFLLLPFIQSAQRAKASLNGADIYSGCCTLKIEYAKPARLNVFKNDQDTWDYTNPNLSGQGNLQPQPFLPSFFLPLFLSCHFMGWLGFSASRGIAFDHR
uniref:PTBP1-like RNA recognition motif 2 domain-containing protein n=1 Tax=Amphilophus citrinellus TaxID=61819 RepID=A0A3Q0QRA3_AMPCI